MKMKALTALWLCFALSNQLKAQDHNSSQDRKYLQERNNLQDSIYIVPFTGCSIVLAGENIQEMVKINNFETLKNKFIQDYRQSSKDKDFPAQAKNIVYMASKDGRRRLKAVPEESTPFDLKNELADFKTNFPTYHYTIYDLPTSLTYHIYLNDPADLENLASINCQKLLVNAMAKDKTPKRFGTIAIGQADTSFVVKRKDRFHTDLLELSGNGGVGLVNGSFSPTIGANIDIIWGEKNPFQGFKFGVGYSFYTFGQLENKKFTNIYPVSAYDIHFLFNAYPQSEKGKWFGLSVGKFASAKTSDGTQSGSLNNAWKAGIVTQMGRYSLQYDFIFDKSKNTNTGLTFKYTF